MDSHEQLFAKIQLLNSMAGQIIAYGEQCGASGLSDYVDMNCGGIPDGEYVQVVDQTAPEQFLSMYQKIAENRFSLAVKTLVKANPAFLEPIEEYCERDGADCRDWWESCLPRGKDNEHSD
ncbi:MAG: hypothetical protein KBT02_11395 [Treponema sp.]|nr:hypothetical protein [Candidatus Treponema caballi]